MRDVEDGAVALVLDGPAPATDHVAAPKPATTPKTTPSVDANEGRRKRCLDCMSHSPVGLSDNGRRRSASGWAAVTDSVRFLDA